MPLSNI
jgi:nucleolin